MPILELSLVSVAILEISALAVQKRFDRSEAVLGIMDRLNIRTSPRPDDFPAIYVCALVEYGVFKPEPILNFFRNDIVRDAFLEFFRTNERSIFDKAAEGVVQWNEETGELGRIDYDPRREIDDFAAAFNRVVDSTRTAAEVKQDLALQDIKEGIDRLPEELGERKPGAPPPPFPEYTPPPSPDPDTLPDPGRLPPGFRLPFTCNTFFTGREEPLKQLARTLLHHQGPATLVTQSIQGMGGLGKTQLAVEFAFRYGRFFHGVHWLNCRDPDAINAEVAACGAAMRLADWPDEEPAQVACTINFWQKDGRRLVILDNLEDIAAAGHWLSLLGAGPLRLLLTARRTDWPDTLPLDPLPLDVFTQAESREFLRQYLPQAPQSELDALAGRLGHLPLALELAGRYLARIPSLSIADYIEKIKSALTHPSMTGWRKDLENPTQHGLDLVATFAVTWDQITDASACHLFLMAGYCAPNQPIPRALLQAAADLEDELFDQALGTLTGLGLLQSRDPAAAPLIHPLLAEYARLQAAAADALPPLVRALGHETNKALDTGIPADFYPLRPHLQTVIPAAEAAHTEDAGTLLNSLGSHLLRIADYFAARDHFQRALKIDEAVYGPDHPSVARDVNNLGRVLQELGDLAGARAACERALKINEAVYGPDHPRVATDVNNLGLVLHDLGDLAGARAAYERALAIVVDHLAPNHPFVAATVNNLGSVLHDLGDLAGARAAYERALKIDEAVYGLVHPTKGLIARANAALDSLLTARSRMPTD